MVTSRDDILSLFDFAHDRLQQRLAGVTAEELAWQPTDDDDLTLRWRLQHLAETLGADRNPAWLGADVSAWEGSPEATPESVGSAYEHLRATLATVSEEVLAQPIGTVGGPFGQDTRRAFALHVVDELVHHGAEAALLRDLYERRS